MFVGTEKFDKESSYSEESDTERRAKKDRSLGSKLNSKCR